MQYELSLIQMTNTLEASDSFYSMILIRAKHLQLTMGENRCWLDGKYLLCLNSEDTLSVRGGQAEIMNLRFLPYFYNVNLNHNVIGLSMYEEMRANYGYPDFHLFLERSDSYFGVLSLNDEEYDMAKVCFHCIDQHIQDNAIDGMWSCRARSDMISVMRIAEGAYLGEQNNRGMEILRYIRDNVAKELSLPLLCQVFGTNRTTLTAIIKDVTGLPPMQYIMEERLNQSRPDLLFTWVPINELALKYGFRNTNYYIRSFKKRFGKSPLQYRIEGRAERIRNETIYHEREKEIMKISDFRTWLEHGLGRAVVMLRRQNDQIPYRGVLVDYLRELPNNSLLTGRYLRDIIDCFGDRKNLQDEITGILLNNLKNGSTDSGSLLHALGYGEEVLVILEQQYREAYEALIVWLENSGEKLTLDADHPLAHAWYQIAAALCRYPLSRERHKQIILDRAGLFAYEKVEYGVPHIPIVMLNYIWDKMGKDYLWKLMDEVAAEHPWGEAAHLKREFVPAPKKKEVKIPDSAQLARAAREIVDGNVPDERKLELLDLFVRHHPDVDPPDWPLSAGPLIELDRRLAQKNGRKDRYAEYPSRVLVRIHCPEVREYGLQLWETGDQNGPLLILANYTAADREMLEDLLYSADNRLRQWSMWQFIYLMEKNTPGLPEIDTYDLLMMAEDLLVSRSTLVKALLACGRVDDELAEELLFDVYREVRELAENYFAVK